MEILQSVMQVKSNLKPCQSWEQTQADNDAKRKELEQRDCYSPQQLECTKKRGKVIIDVIHELNQYSDNKVQDVETGVGYFGMLIKVSLALMAGGLAFLKYKNFGKTILPALAGFALPSVFLILWGTAKEKEAARVAKYQAREKIPLRRFVVYTPEQEAEAARIAKSLPDKPKKDSVEKFHQSIGSLMKDHKDYKAWRNENTRQEEERQKLFSKVDLPPEEIQKAKNDQDLIFRTISKVDKNVKEYSFNTEMLAGLILGSSVFQAFLIEKPLEKLVNTPLIKQPLFDKMPKFKLSTVISGIIALAVTIPISSSLKKDAAQVGRHKAKQELLSEPSNFMTPNQEQMDSVKGVKGEKVKTGFFHDLINDIKFIPQLTKDSINYKKDKKAQNQYEAKFKKALTQIPVTQQQLDDAYKLREKMYRTFNRMDDNSQRYSQDIEGAVQLVKCLIEELGMLIFLTGAVLLSKCKKGNKDLKNISFTDKLKNNKISSKMSKFEKNLNKDQLKVWENTKKWSRASIIGLGALAAFVGGYAGLAWLKKQAARVGIMKSTQELSDYRHFVDDDKINPASRSISPYQTETFKQFAN